MLRNIHDKNPFLLEYIEALKEAITYDGPTGYMELTSLVTTQKSIRAEQDTMTIVVDGREMTVLESTFIVSSNSVRYHGRELTTKQDWISALENLEAEGLWCARNKGAQPAKILQKVSQTTHDLPNDRRSNGKNSTKFIANICKIESNIESAQLDEIAKEIEFGILAVKTTYVQGN